MEKGEAELRNGIALLRRAYALMLAGVLLVIGASVVHGAIPDANGTINACYDKQSGQVRIVDPAANLPKGCGPKEIALSWSAAGDDGQDGVDGEDGQDGVSGYETVYEASDETSLYDKTVSVMCPDGKKALGGGAGVYGHFNGESQQIIFGVALV